VCREAFDRPRAAVIAEAGLTLVDRSSLKAALDVDWDETMWRRRRPSGGH
jgi:hypothetical protein